MIGSDVAGVLHETGSASADKFEIPLKESRYHSGWFEGLSGWVFESRVGCQKLCTVEVAWLQQ